MTLGHVLVDGIGKATAAFLDRYGYLPSPAHIDSMQMEELSAFLAREGGRTAESVSWSMGGGTAITAKAVRAIGKQAEVWASIGRDEHGRFLEREMAATGATAHFHHSDKPTGVFCSFATAGRDKKIIVCPGAARDIRSIEIPEKAFRPGWVLYLDGLLIDNPRWLASQSEKAKAKDMLIAMDISTPGNAREHGAELRGFAEEFCEIVFANEKEFETIGGPLKAGARTKWAVKKGGRGAALLYKGDWIEAVSRYGVPVDDTGAGDVFSAGFLCACLEGRPDWECLRLGNAAAVTAIRSLGSSFDPGVLKQAFEDECLALISSKHI